MRKRNKAITIRFTEEELVRLKEKVIKSGQSLQQYILNAALSENNVCNDADTIQLFKQNEDKWLYEIY